VLAWSVLEVPEQYVEERKVVTMEPSRCIQAHSLIDDVIKIYPETVSIFIRYRLHCPGCLLSPFHTVADSVREYHRDLIPFLEDLNQAVSGVPRGRME